MGNNILLSLFKKEIKEQVRSGKLIILILVFLFFGLLSPIVAKYMPAMISSMIKTSNIHISIPEPTWLDAINQYVKNLTQICSFIIIIIFMGAVAKEKENGTAVFLLVKPVSRKSFLTAKFISASLVIFIGLVVSFFAASIYTYLFFDKFSIYCFAKINILLFIYLLSILFMTVMFSCILNSQLLSAVLSFLSWILITFLSQLGEFGKFLPASLTSQANLLIISNKILWQPILGALIFILFTIFLSYFFFRNWEP